MFVFVLFEYVDSQGTVNRKCRGRIKTQSVQYIIFVVRKKNNRGELYFLNKKQSKCKESPFSALKSKTICSFF